MAQYRLPEANHLYDRKIAACRKAGINPHIWTRRPDSPWIHVTTPAVNQ